VTVVFLLYNAAPTVSALVDALARQHRPEKPRQEEWLEALFMDDASEDGTRDALGKALARSGDPAHWRVSWNERNRGLAASLNAALRQVTTPYALTCHLDCLFGTDDYVSRMVDLMEAHPRAAAITGKPTIPAGTLPFAEKLNLVANLMDVLPASTLEDVVPVGFAEGRCDIFRMSALRDAGFYDTSLRTAGEDQVLAARFRASGYEVYQAPLLPYILSVSGEQDTVGRIVRHQRLFGRAHPYILLRARLASRGVAGDSAGANRSSRMLLRLQQVAATAALLSAVVLLAGGFVALPLLLLAALVATKLVLFRRHLDAVRLDLSERLAFFAWQPVLDASYTLGLAQGLLRVATGSPARPID
jgi:cellulose synthase/poly-beta-1,6-N-acetylglucosamine synthase-like glycosyltransferase